MLQMQKRICSLTEQKSRSLSEQQMINNWIESTPKGVLSIFSNPSDLWELITEYLPTNKEAIMARGEYKVIIPNLSLRKDEVLIPYIESDGKIYYKTTTIGDDDNTKNNYHICQEEIDWQIKQGFIQNTPGKLVIRTNSGDPVDIICGNQSTYYLDDDGCEHYYKHFQEIADNEIEAWDECSINEHKGIIELLWDIFGGTVNEQGYKVLDPHIGAIYGDSITPEHQAQIYERLAAKGFAATNIVLGIGSFTYQYNTRDTLGFAAKGAWFEIKKECTCKDKRPNTNTPLEEQIPWGACLSEDGSHLIASECGRCDAEEGEFARKSYNIYKDPVTDNGVKRPLKGLLQVKLVDNEYIVNQECSWEQEENSELRTIYENGVFKNQVTLQDVRNNLNKNKIKK